MSSRWLEGGQSPIAPGGPGGLSLLDVQARHRPCSPPTGVGVMVLLAGGTAPAPIPRVLGCSMLDLEVRPGFSLLRWWMMRDWCPLNQPRVVRTSRGAGSPEPGQGGVPANWPRWLPRQPIVEHLVDLAGPRGSAGALRDACDGDAPDTSIITAECSAVLVAPLEPILARHAEARSDVTLVRTRSGAPAGVVVVRRSALDLVKARGYVDLKEQFLPALVRAGRRIRVVEVEDTVSIRLHDRRSVLFALGRANGGEESRVWPRDPSQDLGPSGVRRAVIDPRWAAPIVSPSARVDGTAIVSGSLVMGGATIGPGACVARCIVGPGAVVPPGRIVLDRIITAERDWSDASLPRHETRGSW